MRHTMFVFGLLAVSFTANAATLRDTTTLQQPHVRLADLFDDAGPAASRVLGPGPAPGGRIVVEAAQAAAIARQFGVAWRPMSNTERVVIDRPGRLVAREEFLGALHAALAGAGAAPDVEIEFSGFAAPLVPLETAVQFSVEQVDFDSVSGRFTATLALLMAGEAIQRTRLAGRAQEMTDVVVPQRRLAAGVVLGAADVQVVRMRAGAGTGDVARSVSQVLGQATRRPEMAGQPLHLADLGRPFIIQKGSRVMMLLQSPGLTMAASGTATEAGSMGDRIGVMNLVSGALIEAEIMGADQVRVQASSSPRVPAKLAAALGSRGYSGGERGTVR
jgi:flagella basal body P-ring formation protein FlgA